MAEPIKPKAAPPVTAAAKPFKLFELSSKEREQAEKSFADRSTLGDVQTQAEARRYETDKQLFAALVAKYPPSENGVWEHSELGEAAYIEVAINGRYFDPRQMPFDYRPALDVRRFDEADPVEIFAKG